MSTIDTVDSRLKFPPQRRVYYNTITLIFSEPHNDNGIELIGGCF